MVRLDNYFRCMPKVSNPNYIIFTDFDETYFSNNLCKNLREDILKFENFLLNLVLRKNVLFGFVTGSQLSSVLEKMRKLGFSLIPHFIASGLATDTVIFNGCGIKKRILEWDRLLRNSGYSLDKISTIVSKMMEYDVHLEKQPEKNNSTLKNSFYYYSRSLEDDYKTQLIIQEISEKLGVHVNMSRCNPFVGDPENCFDIDFLPHCAGKQKFVEFMINKFRVNRQKCFAFGDSETDLGMLNVVGNGYMVKNATPEAKGKFSAVCDEEYIFGIENVLRNYFFTE